GAYVRGRLSTFRRMRGGAHPENSPTAMAPTLAGRTALISGGARAIRRALARKLAAAGCDVIVNYYNSHEEAEALCRELAAGGRRTLAVQGSVAEPDSVDEMFATIG